MIDIIIREPKIEDREAFLSAMQRSQSLHHPWVKAQTTEKEFDEYFQRYQQENQKSFLVCDAAGSIIGVLISTKSSVGCFKVRILVFMWLRIMLLKA